MKICTAKAWAALCCAALLATCSVHAEDVLTVQSPLEFQVNRRNKQNEANVTISGVIQGTAEVKNWMSLEIRADDYPLTTDTKVDYDALKAGYFDVPEASKLRCFWFWQYGVATKKSITQDLEAMKAKGYGGALLGDNGGTEGQVGPVFMSEEWKENFAHVVKEADRLGLELSLNIQSGWDDPGNPNIRSDNGMKKIVFSEIHVIGPKKLQQKLPKAKFSIYYKDIAVQAFRRVNTDQDKSRSTLHNWDIKSFNKQSGLREHRQNRLNSADDLVIEKNNIVDLMAKFSGS